MVDRVPRGAAETEELRFRLMPVADRRNVLIPIAVDL
jgi:hypothetical protein